mmetsp:Transcript_4479/g.9024  ORF Transcript_4479/g.9024 Transcript_4479/m.9024 type:complete len:313 (-) Transcript_4479:51-989(-)
MGHSELLGKHGARVPHADNLGNNSPLDGNEGVSVQRKSGTVGQHAGNFPRNVELSPSLALGTGGLELAVGEPLLHVHPELNDGILAGGKGAGRYDLAVAGVVSADEGGALDEVDVEEVDRLGGDEISTLLLSDSSGRGSSPLKRVDLVEHDDLLLLEPPQLVLHLEGPLLLPLSALPVSLALLLPPDPLLLLLGKVGVSEGGRPAWSGQGLLGPDGRRRGRRASVVGRRRNDNGLLVLEGNSKVVHRHGRVPTGGERGSIRRLELKEERGGKKIVIEDIREVAGLDRHVCGLSFLACFELFKSFWVNGPKMK